MYQPDAERRRRPARESRIAAQLRDAGPAWPFNLPRGASNAAVARLISAARRPGVLARDDAGGVGGDTQDVGQAEDGGGTPLAEPGLPVPDGTAVLEAPVDGGDPNAAVAGDDGLLQRSVRAGVERQAAPRALLMRDVDPLGGALGGAGFVMSLRQADQGSLGMTHVQFRASGTKKGAAVPVDKEYSILLVDSRHSLGTAWAWFSLFLRVDGANILSGYTRLWSSSGYAGGPLGSDANVSFAAVEGSGAEDDAKSVIITCDGTNNPNGPGFQKFFAQFTAKGNGAVTIDKCVKTVGDGLTKTSPTAYAGFDDSR